MAGKFSVETLTGFCRELLVAVGVPGEDAEVVAGVLIDTSLEGIDTHGISRLPIYLSRVRNGRINARPRITVEKSGAVATVDGDNGLGQLVAVRSMEVAINLAAECGVGFVATRRSNHFGAASYYCKMAARRQMVGMAFTNTPPGIPPWGGRRPYFGTNPIAFAFPTDKHPVVVDMSSSTVARGNIILAAREGREIPPGWAIDAEGRPTTDPGKALEGAVLPVGGAKGYALALAVEVMSGIISGSAYGPEVGWIYDDSLEPVNIGHSFIAIDISRLMPVETFHERMADMIRGIKAVPLAEGFERIFIPGERRQIKAQARMNEGIPVSDNLLKELNELARELGVRPLEG
ncbi:Malate/lactate/ureidoglycolate dehydrogenase, LDH2 family [Desulfofundulus australicus DSM 11792]|uniref:Malate/lactate/ureidoglycolate dehydrogenase, LDH2 family n=1 Tax=Desulfofundulus australicus DSM 11792 TaxID=1121425 RepID=A0A1M4SH78_9FIRM|nr:Ldh family oxidoreductase [Desulfofundulus australicus]SHE31522.1 Malate/lactate/ureidoglycolate dehydrogenase, LDH2 family [Desulfofundulus australicus DSM 11792]